MREEEYRRIERSIEDIKKTILALDGKITDLGNSVENIQEILARQGGERTFESGKRVFLDALSYVELPTHLRRSFDALAKIGEEASANEVAEKTGRQRAVESDYLNQLNTMGILIKRRRDRKVMFSIPETEEEEEDYYGSEREEEDGDILQGALKRKKQITG
jgi:DNA-binding transcriptional ArsR family regulator